MGSAKVVKGIDKNPATSLFSLLAESLFLYFFHAMLNYFSASKENKKISWIIHVQLFVPSVVHIVPVKEMFS